MPTDIVRLIICARKLSLLSLCYAYFYLIHIIIQASGVFSFSPHAILSSTPQVKKSPTSDSLRPASILRVVWLSKQRSIMSSLLELTPEQLSSTPLRLPPDGVQSNFGDAENNNTPMYVVCSLFLAITLCFFANRIYTKFCIVRSYSWDDGKPQPHGETNTLSLLPR